MSDNLKRTLNLRDSISVVAGSMIGCGIFIVTSDIARQVNSAFLVILVWIIAGIFSLSGAIAYAEPVLNIKEDGGQYIFLKKMFNDLIAFLYGWTLLLVIQTATIGAVCIAVGKFLGIIFPFISTTNYIINFPFFQCSTQQFCALIICFLLTFINSRGVQYGVLTQNIFTFTKVFSLLGIIVFGIFFGFNHDVILSNYSNIFSFSDLNHTTLELICASTVGAIFAMVTWNNITFISAEVKEPEKNIPSALLWGVSLVTILYLCTNILYTFSISLEQIQNAPEDVVAVAMMSAIAGDIGKIIITIIILISAFGCANGLIMTGARVYYQMARDNLLFNKLGEINQSTKVPVNSLVLQCLWTSVFIVFCGNYSELLDYVIYAALIFYVLTAIGIFVYRYKYKNEVKNKVNSCFATIFIILGCFILYSITIHKFASSMKTFIIIATGIPIFYAWKKFKLQKACTK